MPFVIADISRYHERLLNTIGITMHSEQLSELVSKTLDDNKAIDIKVIDVRELTDVMDWMIVCSATSSIHSKSMANKVLRAARAEGVKAFGVEGEDDGDWVLIDLNDVVVHIMMPSVREFYSIEKLWNMTEDARKKSTG